jgi:hypothetical protein
MMMSPLGWVLLVMFGAGVFGGLVNYYLALEPAPTKPDVKPAVTSANSEPPAATLAPSVVRSVIVGVAAAALVPLFLNTLSSNVLANILNPMSNDEARRSLLIFGGFCLIAAISSTAFIRTISDRVLRMEVKAARQEASDAKTKAVHVEETVAPIVAKETEPEASPTRARVTGAHAELSEEAAASPEDQVLQFLVPGRWTFRTLPGLAKDTGLDLAEIERIVHDLHRRGLVDRIATPNGERWLLTPEGRALVG